jgi:hypothetical protein
VNGLGVVGLGVMLERLLGWPRFLLILSFAQIGGAALWVAWPGGVAVAGASAAIYGALACWLYLQLVRRHELPVFLRVPAWFWILLLGSGLWIEIELPKVAHAAHVGGLTAGLAISAALVDGPLEQLRARPPRWLCVAATTWILIWGVSLGVGIRRAWGPIEEQAVRTTARLLASPPVSPNVHEQAAGALATLEWRRFQRDGPAIVGVAPVWAKEISVALGASAPRSVVLDLTRPLSEDLTLHTVALEEDSLVGLLEIRLAPSSPGHQRWTDPALERLGPDTRLEITRLDGTPDDAAASRQAFRFWPVVREEPLPP